MPIYEFKCKNCQAVFEMFMKQSDEMDDLKCPICGFKDVEKIFSGFSVGVGRSSASSCQAGCKSPNKGGFS